jgi:hypothetical protein
MFFFNESYKISNVESIIAKTLCKINIYSNIDYEEIGFFNIFTDAIIKSKSFNHVKEYILKISIY